MRKMISFNSAVAISLIACGGGSNNKPVDGKGSGSGSNMVTCEAKASYSPTFGSNDVQQANAGSDGNILQYLGNISEANPIDLLDLELWSGTTDFAGSAAATGTYNLGSNGDSDYATCGACALVWPQVAVGSDGSLTGLTNAYFASHQYVADGGTMTLTSVTGKFTGSLSNVTMRHVDIAAGSNSLTQTDDPDGCKTTVTSVSFTATIQTGSGSNGFDAMGITEFGNPIHIRHRVR